MKIDAVVLAGNIGGSKLAECSETESEALIEIGNRFMVDYVVAALKKSSKIGRIIVVGPVVELTELYKEEPDITVVSPGKTAVETLKKGVRALNAEGMVLVATCDIPLITAEAIDDFLSLCEKRPGADLYYPIVAKESNEKQFPGVKRTYVKLKEGTFTGGNLFLVNSRIIEPCSAKAEEIVSLRKKPLALCRLIGPGFVLKFLLKRLSIKDAEEHFSKLLGIKGVGVISSYPEVGIDVDKPSDLELVRKVLIS
ncbi:nucleotidyltransferase family protein [Calderihabitans maritimus]|uniref:MobA-like NTP transferase domain-containing protein n=1 Tax=Calderihabitans maritimus TaxID=1246530 RepID=A0A1Z5HQ42_9FIRM|nr:nucleotidyltransferase family protein [Calderihabitans maritimus]GAW91652.1 hypothetical protein Moth_0074 [Calderihabitans maritimus]